MLTKGSWGGEVVLPRRVRILIEGWQSTPSVFYWHPLPLLLFFLTFHAGDRGSNPLMDATFFNNIKYLYNKCQALDF